MFDKVSKPVAQRMADEISELRAALWAAVDCLYDEILSEEAVSATAQACAYATGEVPPVMLESHDDANHRIAALTEVDLQSNASIEIEESSSLGSTNQSESSWRRTARAGMAQTHALVDGSRGSLLAAGALSSVFLLACSGTNPIAESSTFSRPGDDSSPTEQTLWSHLSQRWRGNGGSHSAFSDRQTRDMAWNSALVSLVRTVANLSLHDDYATVSDRMLATGEPSKGPSQPASSLAAMLVHHGETGDIRLRTQLARVVSNVAASCQGSAVGSSSHSEQSPFPYAFPRSGKSAGAVGRREKFGDMIHPLMDWRGREGSAHNIDIVLVHGLRGDAYTTWRAGVASDPGASSARGGAVVASLSETSGLEAGGSFVRAENGSTVPIWPVAWLAPELFRKYSVGARVLSIGFDADPFARINRSRDASVPELAAQLEE